MSRSGSSVAVAYPALITPPPVAQQRSATESSKPNPLPPKNLLSRIEEDFDSLPAFKSAFSAAALGMVSSGWLWLVRDQTGRLGIVPTFGAGTVLVQDRMQRGNRDFQASIEETMSRADRAYRAAAGQAPSSTSGESTTSPPFISTWLAAQLLHERQPLGQLRSIRSQNDGRNEPDAASVRLLEQPTDRRARQGADRAAAYAVARAERAGTCVVA